ncbi:MAG: hypothetical protein EXR07_15640 [Acetobacteraceae bacterium]|nr:hypothetical protein [Acetobacteraceae bacterium]
MLQVLSKLRFPVLVLLIGFVLIFFSFFGVVDIKQYKFEPIDPIYMTAAIGVLFVIISALLFCLSEDIIPVAGLRRSRRSGSGFAAQIGKTIVVLEFGRIEDVKVNSSLDAILLPANEFFDDECIDDPRSSLGAFAIAKFTHKISDFKKLLQQEIQRRKSVSDGKKLRSVLVSKTLEYPREKSYGIGTCLYFENPLNISHRLILVSVTTMRVGEGLRSDISYILDAVRNVDEFVKDRKIDNIVMPLFGAGHGALHPEMALLVLLLSLASTLRGGGAHPKSVKIIIFRNAPTETPVISLRRARRALDFTLSLFPPS